MSGIFKKVQIVIFTALVNTAYSQVSPENGKEILEKAVAAALSLKSYRAEVYDSNGYSGVSRYSIRKQISDSVDIGLGKCTFWVSGSRTQNQNLYPMGLAYDGQYLRILDPTDNAVLLFERPSSKVFGAYMGRLNYPSIAGIMFFAQEDLAKKWMNNIQAIELKQDVNIYGRECFSIFVTRKILTPDKQEMLFNTTYFVDKKDYQIRGCKGERDLTRVKVLETNKGYDFSSFEISIPDGFREKKVENYISANKRGLLSVDQQAPNFTLRTAEGNEKSLQDYRGKVVLLDFWGTWCGPCRLAMPHLQSLYNKYKDKGLEVIGISVADADGRPEKFMKDNRFTYGLLVKGESVAKTYRVDVFPTVYLIDASGKIVHAEKGIRESFEKEISVKIEELLQK